MARTRNAMEAATAVLVVAVLVGGIAAAVTATSAGSANGGSAASAASVGAQECSFPYTSTDATGTEVTIEEEPRRVVTTNPDAAQTMKEIGAWGKVVGLTAFAGYLEGADEKADVSGEAGASVERVVAQDPDLVLVPNATYGNQELVEQLRDAGLTVYHFRAAESLDGVGQKTLRTGRLVGECEGAEETVDEMDVAIRTVREAVEGEERPRVLFVLDQDGYVAGSGTFIHTAVVTAGAENIAAERGITFYQQISPEVVAEADPEWIVKPEGATLPDAEAYDSTTAIREGNVLAVDQNHVSQPAPQIVGPIQAMAEAFHPEAYAQANATATPTPTPEPPDTATPSPTPANSPGFGAALAVLTLVLTLVGAVRRR